MSVILTGKVEAPDGEWLVGDAFPEGHPGRIQPDDPRRLLFKVWRAGNSEKYSRMEGRRGWEPPLPAHDGRVERVQVFTGRFACETGVGIGPILYFESGGSVDLCSNDYRCWFLPPGSTGAAGIALCSTPTFGENSFEYHGHSRNLVLPGYLNKYVPENPHIRWMLVTVLEDEIVEENSGVMLGPLEYAFFPKGHRGKWRIATPPVSFAALYF